MEVERLRGCWIGWGGLVGGRLLLSQPNSIHTYYSGLDLVGYGRDGSWALISGQNGTRVAGLAGARSLFSHGWRDDLCTQQE